MAAIVPRGIENCAFFKFPDRFDPAIIPRDKNTIKKMLRIYYVTTFGNTSTTFPYQIKVTVSQVISWVSEKFKPKGLPYCCTIQ